MSLISTLLLLCSLVALEFVTGGRVPPQFDVLWLPSEVSAGADEGVNGTRWAVLVAGSSGYQNYRHQADVCHAYQTLIKGGLKEENIVVFMYDDIAQHKDNPRSGIIINHPHGDDVYAGVPKDYVGDAVTVNNLFAVLLGNKSALTGEAGKVVDSGPNDHIFVFYSDHGGPGVLGMPTSPYVYANDLVNVLKKKHASGTYKSLVFYLEACESGSIFEGLLPGNLNIYATTAANAVESSYGTYCPDSSPGASPEYDTCLGDLYSVSWIEDSDVRDLRTETLKQQYQLVKERTSNHNTYNMGSHVMQFGDLMLNKEMVYMFMGSNKENNNSSFINHNSLPSYSVPVNQRDADLIYFMNKYQRIPDGSPEKLHAQKQLFDVMAHRLHVDESVELIGKLLFGSERAPEVLKAIRQRGQPLVDDWDCLKTMVRAFEMHCGSLSQYGMKHMRSIANICNEGIRKETMAEVSAQACTRIPAGPWSSLHRGFSA